MLSISSKKMHLEIDIQKWNTNIEPMIIELQKEGSIVIDKKDIAELKEVTKVTFYKIFWKPLHSIGWVLYRHIVHHQQNKMIAVKWKVYVVSEVVYAETVFIEVAL